MVYDYLVKHDGKYYQPGEEVPDNKEPLSEKESDKDIVFETDAMAADKPTIKRGRPKKSE